MDEWMTKLRAQIIDKKDAENFDDLIKCYQNGLLRAGFLLAWLMLIESLKRKIVDLANKGVKVAVSELKTITTTEDAMHSNDEVMWKGALKCDLITKRGGQRAGDAVAQALHYVASVYAGSERK